MTGDMVYSLDHMRQLLPRLAEHGGVKLSTLGDQICGNPVTLDRIRKGGGCQAATAEKITRHIDEHWPKELAWPMGVPRNPAVAAARPGSAKGGTHDSTARAALPR